MAPTTRDQRELAELQTLKTILEEMGFESHLLKKSARVPHHVLVTRIPMPHGQEPLEMALSFYPVEPNTVERMLLLQYYIQLPYEFDEEALEHYHQVIPDLNGKAVLGHFGVDIGSRMPHYRYVQALPIDRTITKDAVLDVIVLVAYTPALFGELLEGVANKSVAKDAARTWTPPSNPRAPAR